MSNSDPTNKDFNNAISQENWLRLRQLASAALEKNPDDHWLLDRLAMSYYEERDYRKAYKLLEKMLSVAPQCPLVLWDLAGALDMLGKNTEAIRIWRRLIERGVKSVARDECGEGMRWAKSLLNDCRYRIAMSLWDLGDVKHAYQEMQQHLNRRSPGIPSVYPIREARAKFATLGRLSSAVKKESLQPA